MELRRDWDGTKTEPIFVLFYDVPFKVLFQSRPGPVPSSIQLRSETYCRLEKNQAVLVQKTKKNIIRTRFIYFKENFIVLAATVLIHTFKCYEAILELNRTISLPLEPFDFLICYRNKPYLL